MEFKGTKGKWFITENGLSVSSIANKKHIHDGTICRFHTGVYDYENYKYNALLISKAPEMLEMLNEVLTSEYVKGRVLKELIKKLIKEATGLK